MEKQLVIFELAGEHFGIDIAAVEGIVKMQKITRVPKSPDYVEGVTNLRGSVLPVVDLAKRFGVNHHQETRESRIVVAHVGNVKIGMIVSAVSEVLSIDESTIEPPPPIVASIQSEFITGVAKIDSRLVILLDLGRVLTQQEQEQALELAHP